MATEHDELKPTPEQEKEHERRQKTGAKMDAKLAGHNEEAVEDKQAAPAAPPEPATPPKKRSPK